MKIGELRDLLAGYSDDLDISIVISVKDECSCNLYEGEYCYCSYHDKDFYISSNVSDHIVYNKKTKKQELVGVVLRGE